MCVCVMGSGPGPVQGDVWTPTLSAVAISAWPLSASTLIQQPSTLHYSVARLPLAAASHKWPFGPCAVVGEFT